MQAFVTAGKENDLQRSLNLAELSYNLPRLPFSRAAEIDEQDRQRLPKLKKKLARIIEPMASTRWSCLLVTYVKPTNYDSILTIYQPLWSNQKRAGGIVLPARLPPAVPLVRRRVRVR